MPIRQPRSATVDDDSGTLGNHSLDWRAIGGGALAQGLITFLLFVARMPVETFLLGVVASATAAALLSRNYRDEFLDSGIAAGFGAPAALIGVIAGIFFNLRAAPLGLRLDVTVVLGLYGLFIAVMFGVLSTIGGAVVGYVVAHYKERWRLRRSLS